MKYYFMTLMPYAAIDQAERLKYDSAWVTLPNSLYDPKEGARLYQEYIDDLVRADQLGFDGVCVNEHHQTAYGMMPSPIVIASILARETKNCKIAILGSAIPLRDHPLTLAEEHAMIDTISKGRLITGMVRGIGAEYHAFGTNPAKSHERFHEAHDLIIKAWTQPGPFHYESKHYDFKYVNIWPTPYQKPHPPIWIPSQGSQETIEFASHPDHKYTYLQTFSPAVQVKKFLDAYRQQAETYGYEADDSQLGWSVPVYVGETDEQAIKEARPHFDAFRTIFAKMPMPMLLPPGYTSVNSLMRLMGRGNVSHTPTLEEAIKDGIIICGSADTVREKLAEHHDNIRFGHFLANLQFGTMPAEMTKANMHRFAEQVMEPLRARKETKQKTKQDNLAPVA
ncbi:LLM class flavin-dependent oxidoreductase [Caulobacter sp. S45]|uniref:LLM class flavin-dependent oxidoreductase n=1 Tax=Caulobacter sp. S45 TaxID=1641861 RepID=UPI00131B6829|nr:LLM class flavin-dependent oxidoreductase [Caulobacter sp. S45]